MNALLLGGNGCEHVPLTPNFYKRPTAHAMRPKLLEQAIEKLAHAYYRNSRFLRNLHFLGSKPRKKRSERMEAIITVAQTMVHYVDAWTLQVGLNTQEGEFHAFDLKFIAQRAGLTLIRTRRALYDLCKAGYLKVTRRYKKTEQGGYTGLASIRELTPAFFNDLNIPYHQLYQLQQWKRKRQEIAQIKAKKKQSWLALMKGIISTGERKQKKPIISIKNNDFEIKARATLQAELQTELHKEILSRAYRMKKLYPKRSFNELVDEVKLEV
jgi:hypothetical protein